jgi:hypothetical protein
MKKKELLMQVGLLMYMGKLMLKAKNNIKPGKEIQEV